MSWLSKPISPRGGMLLSSGFLGAAGWELGNQIGMSIWNAFFFGAMIFGGISGLADYLKGTRRHALPPKKED